MRLVITLQTHTLNYTTRVRVSIKVFYLTQNVYNFIELDKGSHSNHSNASTVNYSTNN